MKLTRLSFLLTLALFVSSAFLAAGADAGAGAAVKHADAAAAAKLLKEDPNVIVLDIRTPKEFGEGHLKGAKNVDFNAADFEANLKKLATDKTYLVNCASGGRSTKSLELFKRLGFKSVVHLDGGFKGWEKAGQPVEK